MPEPPATPRQLALRLPGLPCKRVLSWVHSLAEADSSVPVARALARSAAGSHQVVMCLETHPGNRPGLPGRRPLTPQLIGEAQARLTRLYGWRSRVLVLPGHPLVEVRRYARNKRVDLVVLGEQALAVERAYRQRLCDDAPCAVMILLLPQEQSDGLPHRVARQGGAR